MKRVAVIVIFMAVMASLFAFPVLAASDMTFPVSRAHIYTSGSVEYNMTVTRLVVNADTTVVGGAYVPYLICASIHNSSTTQDALVSLDPVIINFSSSTQVMGYENYSPDLIISVQTSNTSGTISPSILVHPSSEFSYNNQIVVPANTTLYLVSQFNVYCSFNTTTQSWDTTIFNDFTTGITSVTMGNYSYGVSVDLSSVIEVLEDIQDTMITQAQFNNLINAVSYSGNFNISPINGNAIGWQSSGNTLNAYSRYSLYVYVEKPIIDDIEFQLDPSNDVVDVFYKYHRHVNIEVIVTTENKNTTFNTGQTEIRTYNFGNNNLLLDNIRFTSNNGQDHLVFQDKNFYIYSKYTYNGAGIFPIGRSIYNLEYDLIGYSNQSSTITMSNTETDYVRISIAGSIDGSYPLSEDMLNIEIRDTLNNIYDAYSQVNGLDNSSDISSDVTDVSDSNHIIEESYYSANASAIEATGLSNYRFSNEQNNGIGSVADDFMLLWNALGSWNGVYIFSLTMALATFIMRHGGLFTVKRTTSDKGGEGE